MGEISIASHSDDKDLRLSPSGLRGAELYSAEELSPVRPAELTVRADWVSAPQPPEQERYTNAEAVYRSFVYDNYAQPDASLAPLLEQMFWGEEYRPENDGVYSALDRIRSVLKRETVYDSELKDGSGETDDDADILREFLIGTRHGNAVLYASAAVEALRAHGIPARYVEGYYLSSSAAGW